MPRGRRRQPGEGVVDRTAHVDRTAPEMEQEHNIQPALFDLPPQEPVEIKIPEWWHSSKQKQLPQQQWGAMSKAHGHGFGFHLGAPEAALDRSGVDALNADPKDKNQTYRRYMHPVYLSGKSAKVPVEHQTEDPDFWTDNAANYEPEATAAVTSGKNVHYWNDYEAYGYSSVRAPRENIMSWSEHVLAHPEQHHYYERKAAHKGAELVYGLKDPIHSYRPEGFEDESVPLEKERRFETRISGKSKGFKGTNLTAPTIVTQEHEFGNPEEGVSFVERGVLSPHLVFPKQNKPKSRKNSAEQPRLPGM